MTPALHNEMILASAGSGKTHTLVNRFLRLLRAGVPPEKLMALTFTRKAASEFFAKILMRLAEALENESKREALAKELGVDDLSPAQVCEDLQRLIHAGPRLQLGTLDAFFVRILQSFYLEFGFSAGFTLLDDYGAREAERRAREAAFKRLREAQAVTEFLEGMRQATFGSEEKSLQYHLEGFVGRHHGVFLKGSDRDLWGGEEAIWAEGCVWLQGGALDVSGAAAALMASVEADGRYTPKRDVGGWEKAATLFRAVRPDRLIRSKPNTVALRLLEAGLALADGTAAIRFGKKDIALKPEQCRHVFTLVHHVMRCEILAAQQRTRGLWQVLHTYEEAYHREVRSKGQLTFGDVQRLLASGDLALTQDTNQDAEGRLLEIAYRMDARSDHWMLDEFQDTSRVQWRVIAPLVDEVMQGGLPDRSLFYVGDVKQAIYAWREGDARLFHQIFDHYNQGAVGNEGAIREVALNRSYRCCQDVIDAVNRVFSSHSTLRLQFGMALGDRWERVWGEHSTHVAGPGYVALLNPVKEQSARSVEPKARYALATETLKRLDPIKRGLSCGVLVRQNKVGREFADYLRKHTDIPVESESDVQVVADNPVTSAFLSLFTAAAHPGDTLSWQHLSLTPFRRILADLQWTHADCVREILKSVHQDGFEAVIRNWTGRLSHVGVELDAFSKRRVETLCDSAASFDARGDRSVTRFVDFAQRFVERQQAGDGAVQVMSIHKAKGLEFDVVLLLLAGTDDLRSLRHLSVVAHADEEEPVFVTGLGDQGQLQWALDMPRATYAKVDPVLRTVLEARETEVCYENLCLLYVAMTRAKRGLYIICDPVGSSSDSNNYSRLLRETLSEGQPQALGVKTAEGSKALGYRLFSQGQRDWFESISPSEDTEELPNTHARVPTERIPLRAVDKPTLHQRQPSQKERGEPVAATGWELLSERAGNALDYGTLVHALFESIEWLEDFGDDWEHALPKHWDQKVHIPDTVTRAKIHAEVIACFRQPDIRKWFLREAHGGDQARVWREKAFDVILDGKWVSGVFDRVIFSSDSCATILDFKSNRLGDGNEERLQTVAATYANQMADYRNAMRLVANEAALSKIGALLLFTDARKLVAP